LLDHNDGVTGDGFTDGAQELEMMQVSEDEDVNDGAIEGSLALVFLLLQESVF